MANTEKGRKEHPLSRIFQRRNKEMRGINILPLEDSRLKWRQLFGTDAEFHKLPDDHWVFHCEHSFSDFGWRDDYSADIVEPVATLIAHALGAASGEVVYFFRDPYEFISMQVEVFVANWIEFIELDDEALIWSPRSQTLLRVMPLGGFKFMKIPEVE